MRRVALPIFGATNAQALADTPPGFAPLGPLRNFSPRSTNADRARGGQRAGLSRVVAEAFGTGPMQKIASVSLSSRVTGFQLDPGSCEEITDGSSRESEAIEGHCFLLDAAGGMDRDFYNSTPGSMLSANAVCFSPAGTKAYFAVNYTATMPSTSIRAVDLATGATLWTSAIESVSKTHSCNTIDADNDYVYVATVEGLVMLERDTGSEVYNQPIDQPSWSSEIVEARVRPDGQIVVAFNGADTNVSLAGGTAGGSDFRSGIALYERQAAVIPIRRVRFGSVVSASDDWYEGDHGYYRVSEHGAARPHGCAMTGLAVGADNSVIGFRRNKGWGPNGAYVPGDSIPPITVFKLSASGELLWEADTASIRDAYSGWFGTVYNDRGSTDPSIHAGCVLATGEVVCAGARSPRANNACAFLLDGDTGVMLDSVDLGGVIRQAACALVPSAGLVALGGDRNTGWPDAGGANAHLWLVDTLDLSVARAIDLSHAVSCLGVDARDDDALLMVTDYVAP